MAILGVVVWQCRRRRPFVWRQSDLIFEDVLATEVEPLRLSASRLSTDYRITRIETETSGGTAEPRLRETRTV